MPSLQSLAMLTATYDQYVRCMREYDHRCPFAFAKDYTEERRSFFFVRTEILAILS